MGVAPLGESRSDMEGGVEHEPAQQVVVLAEQRPHCHSQRGLSVQRC